MPVCEGLAMAEERGTTVAVTVSSRSGSQVSSSSAKRVASAASGRAAPTATREKSRREARAPADWKRMMDKWFSSWGFGWISDQRTSMNRDQ